MYIRNNYKFGKFNFLFIFTFLLFGQFSKAQCVNPASLPSDTFILNYWRPTCVGASDGIIEITNITGLNLSPSYSVRILSGVGGTPTTVFTGITGSSYNITGLPAGTYTVDIQDQCGNTSADKQIIIPPAPSVTLGNAAGTPPYIRDVIRNPDCANIAYQVDLSIAYACNGGTYTGTITNNIGTVTTFSFTTGRHRDIAINACSFVMTGTYHFSGTLFNIPASFFNGGPITIRITSPCGDIRTSIVNPPVPFSIQNIGGHSPSTSGCTKTYDIRRARNASIALNNMTVTAVETDATYTTIINNPALSFSGNPLVFNGAMATIMGSTGGTLVFTGLEYNKYYRITYTDACGNTLSENITRTAPVDNLNVQPGGCASPFSANYPTDNLVLQALVSYPPGFTSYPPYTAVVRSGPAQFQTTATGPSNPPPVNMTYPITSPNAASLYLPPGTYVIDWTDACGHTATVTTTTANSCIPEIITTYSLDYCNANSGTANLSYRNTFYGGGQFRQSSFSIFNSSGTLVQTVNSTTPNFTNLPPGTYKIRFGGDHGVSYIPAFTLFPGGFAYEEEVVIPPITPLSFTLSGSTCGTTVSIAGVGGQAPYQYNMYTSSGGTLVSGPNTTGVFTGLIPGNSYYLEVRDACGRTFGDTLEAYPTQLPPAIGTVTQGTCTTLGSVELTNLPSGNWTVTQIPGGNTYTGNTSSLTISNLAAGSYNFTVTNLNGCTSSPTVPNVVINTIPICPTAVSDIETYTIGTPVTVTVLANDSSDNPLNPATVNIIGGVDTDGDGFNESIEIPGEGKWIVDPVTGTVTFIPFVGFTGIPTPISYNVQDVDGDLSNTVTITLTAIGVNSTTICSGDALSYQLQITVTVGTAPFTVTGTGTPGTWAGNVWTSNSIPRGTSYNVTVTDSYLPVNNSITVSDIAPDCCVFAVTCPTFPATTVQCYADLPSATTLTEAEFEALGNGNGIIGDYPCGVIEITAANGPDTGSCNYSVSRTYTVTEYDDPNNNNIRDVGENTILNTINCSSSILIHDTTPPVFVEALPGNVTVACDDAVVASPAVLTATDNCGTAAGSTATVTFNETTTAGSCPNSYTLTRTWTATDLCGLTTVHTQTITVQDTTPPTFVEALPTNVTVECSAIPTAPVLTATDNCGTATVAYNQVKTNGSCANSYTLTRTWTATDACGLTTTHVQTISVQDTTPPAFVGVLPADVTVECSAIPTAPVVTATDNCGTATVVYNETSTATAGTCANYTLTRTWTATDACGLTTTHVQTITVQDTTPPAFVGVLPANVTVECNAIPTAPILTATDCSTVTVVYNETSTATAGTCANYTLTRTWTATDLCGLTTVHTQTITVQDTTPPAFVGVLPTNVTVQCSAIPTAPTLTATDNCGTATVAYNETSTAVAGTCANYTITRTWTATDLCGLTTVHTQTITVQDTTAPIFNSVTTLEEFNGGITPPTNWIFSGSFGVYTNSGEYGLNSPSLQLNDNLEFIEIPTSNTISGIEFWLKGDGTDATSSLIIEVFNGVTWSTFHTISNIPATGTNYVFNALSIPSLSSTYSKVRFVYSKSTGNIAIDDIKISTNILPNDVIVGCNGVPTAPIITATDNCGTATVTFNETTTAGSCANNYTLTRTWTATDLCGLTTVHTQTITVQDTTAPTFVEALPTNVTVECDAVVIGSPTVLTATDNCGTATVAYNEVRTNGSCPNNYTLTRTWTATDLCGLTTVHTQTITVQDTTAPTFVEALPANVTVECDAVVIGSPAVLTATDNCGTATVTFNETTTAGSCTNNYTLTRTWTATDLCGLTTVHTQTITVQDSTPPTFVEALPANIAVECDAVVIGSPAVLTATDNCGTATVTFNETTIAGSCANNYIITRTWTATDICGLTTVHTQTITVQDSTPPTFVEALPANVTVACDAIPTAPTLTATDNCGTATVVLSETSTAVAGTCANYTITRTWTATDLCGLTTIHTQTITVQDIIPPTFVEALPTNVTVACDAIPTAPTLTATDNCGTATVTFNETSTAVAGTCANYTITRTWTATDACGLTTVHTQTIIVQDIIPPTFVEALPANTTVACDAIPTATTLTATDNCGTATVDFNETSTAVAGTCANYTITRTWTATDLCGLTTVHTQTITVQDIIPPTFVEALPTNVTVECDAIPTAPTLTATDNCGTATVTFNEVTTAGSCANNYTLTRTWTATDVCGLTTVHTQTITVQDTTPPTFVETLPVNVTVECDAVVIGSPAVLTATDNCGTAAGGAATVDFNETSTAVAGTCANYTITRTWTATDACGLTTVHTQIITVQDITPPTFVEALPANVTVECDAVVIGSPAVLTATDNCGTATVTFNETTIAGSCPNNYIITRTWTATDICGLTTVHTQTITVQDSTPPTFVEALPANVTVACDAIPTAPTLTATDNCGTATVDFNETSTAVAGTCANYTITRTWTATDLCGLTTVHTQTITVQDIIPPTFVEALPANTTVACDAIPTAPILTATDNCGTATVVLSETSTAVAGTCANYTITRTWTATDLCGLTTVHTQIITVQDTTPPTFVEALPANITVACDAIPTAPTLTATDNCGTASVDFNETSTAVAGTCANYTITRTWTTTDLCGLTTIHTQTITVQDTTSPTFVEALPANTTVACDAIPTAPTLTATDNCGTATVTFNETSTAVAGTCANYTITRTWTATDLCGLTTVHTQTITVQDSTPPTFVEALPANTTVACDTIPTAPTLTATDNCGTATVDFNETSTAVAGTCANYTITRTWTATDACGLTTVHTQIITVQDITPPTFVEALPANVTVECDAVVIGSPAVLTATDNCGTATVDFNETSTAVAGTCANYTITRTWTATDLCGLTTVHTQTITVQDIIPPTFVEALPANTTVACDAIPTAPTLTATDNCGSATVTFNETSTAVAGTCANYTITRTWTATDLCGLTTVHTQTITVQDIIPPTFVEALPANTTVACDAIPTAPILTATDNCGTATVVLSETSTAVAGTCANYTITRTWTATDLCGLTTVHTQIITVQDTTPPTFVEALPANITVACDAIPTAPTLTATDNCGTASVDFNETSTAVAGTCANYTITRTWTTTDLCGLTTIHTQTITVQDTTPPTFVEALPVDYILECTDIIPTAPILTAIDNCGTVTVNFTEQRVNGSCSSNYELIRTWTASDSCGNETTHIQIIDIQDTTAPVFTGDLPSNTIAECDNIPVAPTLTATDNCGSVTITYDEQRVDGDCSSRYELIRTWIATDDCGNSTTHTQVLTLACHLKIWNAISANGDGVNDTFFLEGIDCYPNNKVEIYNRWGVKVFETTGYDNISKVFSGYSDGRATISRNELLPTGVYFYILKYEYTNNGSNEKQSIEKTGHLYIQNK